MSDSRWIRISAVDAIPSREGRIVRIGSDEIAIFNLGDRFLAVRNRCPHKGGPLADGIVTGRSVVCPLHAWKVNLESGCVERPAGETACVERYSVRVDEGIVSIELRSTGISKEGEAA